MRCIEVVYEMGCFMLLLQYFDLAKDRSSEAVVSFISHKNVK